MGSRTHLSILCFDEYVSNAFQEVEAPDYHRAARQQTLRVAHGIILLANSLPDCRAGKVHLVYIPGRVTS